MIKKQGNTSRDGWGTIPPPLPPLQNAGFGGDLEGGAATLRPATVGRREGRKGAEGEGAGAGPCHWRCRASESASRPLNDFGDF